MTEKQKKEKQMEKEAILSRASEDAFHEALAIERAMDEFTPEPSSIEDVRGKKPNSAPEAPKDVCGNCGYGLRKGVNQGKAFWYHSPVDFGDCKNPQPKAPPVGSKKYPSCDAPIGQFCKKHQCIHTTGSAEIRVLKEAEPKLKR